MNMNWIAFHQIIIMAFAVSAISVTITKAKVFARLRKWIKSKNKWFGDLISCPYCMSHWISIGLVLIYRPDMFSFQIILDLSVAIFLMIAIAAIISGIIINLYPFTEEKTNNNQNTNTTNSQPSW